VNGSEKGETGTGGGRSKHPKEQRNFTANKGIELMSNRETEKQRHGDTDVTEETEDVPPLAACVKTLPEAVQLSLMDGLNTDCLFVFSRTLKAFEITNNRRLSATELQAAFAQWWNAAKPLLPPDADFDEWRFDFEATFPKTHAAMGANSLQEAIRRAGCSPLPPQAERYASLKLKHLVAVCYHLQLLQGRSPFFLSVRDAARILETNNLHQANAKLAGLVRDGILIEAEKGTRKRATRYRFNLPESASAVAAASLLPTQDTVRTDLDQPKLRAQPHSSNASHSPSPRPPTTYALVERKKALQDLIKGLGHKDNWEAEHRKRHAQLKKQLRHVNVQLAGVDC